MANKKKNPAPEPTPEQQARAASSSRKKQRKTRVSKTVKIVLVVIGVLAMLLSVSVHTLLEVNLLLNHLVEPELRSYLKVSEDLPSLETQVRTCYSFLRHVWIT